MPRDYKHTPREHKQPGTKTGNLLPFITGLVLGLFVAFIVYLNQAGYQYNAFRDSGETTAETPAAPEKESSDKASSLLPGPKFDFYNILPNREINISEWIADEPAAPRTKDRQDSGGVYLLQVGSFRQFDAADQVKARLALLGIVADIQRVVINGQDTRYRVRVGPYTDHDKLETERRRLRENGLEYMLLELKTEDAE